MTQHTYALLRQWAVEGNPPESGDPIAQSYDDITVGDDGMYIAGRNNASEFCEDCKIRINADNSFTVWRKDPIPDPTVAKEDLASDSSGSADWESTLTFSTWDKVVDWLYS